MNQTMAYYLGLVDSVETKSQKVLPLISPCLLAIFSGSVAFLSCGLEFCLVPSQRSPRQTCGSHGQLASVWLPARDRHA